MEEASPRLRRAVDPSAPRATRWLERGNVHPGAVAAAFQLGFQDGQLAQAVHELRVLGLGGRVADGIVEAAEDLLEGVVVAFAVAAGKVGVGARALASAATGL